jgi:hypothetical protein
VAATSAALGACATISGLNEFSTSGTRGTDATATDFGDGDTASDAGTGSDEAGDEGAETDDAIGGGPQIEAAGGDDRSAPDDAGLGDAVSTDGGGAGDARSDATPAHDAGSSEGGGFADAAIDAGAYGIGGQLAGLTPGETITLQDNLGDNVTLSNNGTFTFPTPVADGAPYAVTILTSPSSPIAQTCSLANAAGTVPAAPVMNVTVNCDLLAYFPFSGNANDASGYGHNAVVTGASLTTDRNGNLKSAYSFTGSGNIQATMPAGFLPSGSEARTLTAWMQPTQNTNMWGVVYWGMGNCTGQNFAIGDQANDLASFWSGCNDYESALLIPVNLWSFVAVVYSSATPTTITIYVNALSATGTIAKLSTPNTGNLVMGADLVNLVEFMGNLDSVRVYGHALAAAEVQSIFTSSAP